MRTIRAPRWQRRLELGVSALLTVMGIGLGLAGRSEDGGAGAVMVTVGALVGLPGIAMVLRWRGVAVRLSDTTLRYDGYLLSWQAPRDGITVVLDDATVEWRDGSGVEHRRQLWLLTQAWEDDGTRFAPIWRWRREALLAVREWAGARAV
ncbi:hypothetical protein [Curtobacterium sp. ISL-83]|uniref:hypothetical protein n=1 Tax=Curtobacterium sp. ISL-83 TaxID=2819145 RepID=UPI001BEA3ACC|nr:hypothetical protein [Curtobacterium sp. ISL-83]MBT2503610.1 hypothetical protein [Curtobacterium sp. ISL-83]